MEKKLQVCSRCIMDETVPDIRFDKDGICHLCYVQDRLYKTHYIEQDIDKEKLFHKMIEAIKISGQDKTYDCIVPISGGGDSSYTLFMTKKLGLRPVAYHFNNGWQSDIARENIEKVTSKLDVPLKTIEYPWEDLRDAYKACLKASIPEVCLPCLVAVWSLAYKAAAIEGIRYVIHGSSPLTEGIFPIAWSYVDGRYLEGIVRNFGRRETLKVVHDFNMLRIGKLFYNTVVRQTRIIMLPLHIEWNDHKIKELLRNEFNWMDGGKHADCVYTPFRNYVIWKKFNYDLRKMAPAALIRDGRIYRENALNFFKDNPMAEDENNTAMILEKLGITRSEFEEILSAPPRNFHNYPTYYPLLKRMKRIIKILAKRGMLSGIVYEKYFEC